MGIATDKNISSALLQFVRSNQFPEIEEVASASVRVGSLPDLTDGLRNARENLEDDIRRTSSRSAKDVDGWIAQAKQLQQDIEASRKTAREIVKEAETAKHLQNCVDNLQKKSKNFEKELQLDEKLSGVLNSIRSLDQLLGHTDAAIDKGCLLEASNCLQACELNLSDLKYISGTTCVDVMKERIRNLKFMTLKKAHEAWDELLCLDFQKKAIIVTHGFEDANKSDLLETYETLLNLGKIDDVLSNLCQTVISQILIPCLSSKNGIGSDIEIRDNGLFLIRSKTKANQVNTACTLRKLVEFLNSNLPKNLQVSLSNHLMQPLKSAMTRYWLEPSMQKSLNEMKSFDDEAQALQQLAYAIDEFGWYGKDLLLELVKSIPRFWIIRRKEAALANVRTICIYNFEDRIETDKLEPQTSEGNEPMNEEEGNEWDSEWPDEQDQDTELEHKKIDVNLAPQAQNQSGRGNQFPRIEANAPHPGAVVSEIGESADDWDWENEDGNTNNSDPQTFKSLRKTIRGSNGTDMKLDQIDQGSTRLVRYTITGIPDRLSNAIEKLILDANQLSQPNFQSLSISGARVGLYSIPVLVMALYRAVAFTYYSQDPSGSILLFNDVNRLAECLQSLQQKLDPEIAAKLRLDAEVKALVGYGRRIYEREMESQRLIIRDLLDIAQGFTNCASATFAIECDKAVAMVVDRIFTLHKQWKGMLTPSTLLQLLGSLCTTVLGKIIVDIEDMSDISEEESNKLRQYCDEVSKVKQLFSEETKDNGAVDKSALFISNWFKFQYLAEIMESSLADIKFLWSEGELRLYFEAEEIVDLIEALFAESDYRRKAVNDIKRSSRS